ASINATMEIMGANQLLRALIDVSQKLNINADKIAVWKSMLTNMPPYELNEQGELKEWMWNDLEDNHKHRHASHLFRLYDLHDPLIMENEQLREGSKKVIDRRRSEERQDNGGIMARSEEHT